MAASPQLFLFQVILLISCFTATLSLLDPGLQDDVFYESGSDQKVELSVYYEALCPYCANFLLNQLVELFKTDIVQIVNLRLIPWGNASVKEKSAIACQHGSDECRLNTIEACVINTWPDFRRHYGLIHCIERLVFTKKESQLQRCFNGKSEWQTLKKCYSGGLGIQLDLKYGDETTHLNPTLQFVPWVVVNGHPLIDDYGKFMTYVCEAYTGTKPEGCRSVQHMIAKQAP